MNRFLRAATIFTTLICLVIITSPRAQAAYAYGAEWLDWREYDFAGTQLLSETGPRYYVEFTKEDDYGDVIYAAVYRPYLGTVLYNGQTMAGTPVVTDTNHVGLLYTQSIIRPFASTQRLIWSIGFEVDSWFRTIQGTGGYTEWYTIMSARTGIHYKLGGTRLTAGLKIPFFTVEMVFLSVFGNPMLEPKGKPSLYLGATTRIAEHMELELYYDTHRFNASDPMTIFSGGIPIGSVHQPGGLQSTIGLSLRLQL